MIINSLSIRDLDKVLEIEKKCFADPWTKGMFLSEILSEFSWFFTVCEEDEIVGFAGIRCVLDEAEIVNIAVLPEYRGRGLGQMLLDKLIAFAKEKGASFISLEVRKSNQAARRLYLKNGFREVGLRKGYYENNGEDAVLMRFDVEKFF